MHATGSASRFAVVLTGCLIALIAAIALIIQWFIVDTPASTAERSWEVASEIARDVRSALQIQPTVIVNERTVIEQDADVLELATLERQLTERYRWQHSWLGSTKSIEVEGVFAVRAGFDLADPFVVRADPATGAVAVNLPPAKILTVEMTDFRILTDDSGWWNQLTSADREQAVATLRRNATRNAAASNLRVEARSSAETRLREILERDNRTITFEPLPAARQ